MIPSRRILFLFGSLLLSSLPAVAQQSQSEVLYLAHLNPNDPENPTGAMALAFKADLEQSTDRHIQVEIFPEGQLGSDSSVVELVRKGVIQSAIVSVGGMSRSYPLIGVLDYPFRFRDLDEVYRVFDGPFGERLGEDIKAHTGLTVLEYGDTGGLFVLTNSRREVHKPDDVADLRIRTMDLESHKAFVESLGATPVVIDWSEVYSSLQNGTVTGQMNPAPIIITGGLDRVQRFLTVTNHLYTPYIWLANTAWLETLAEEDHAAVAAAARKGVDASRRLAATDSAFENLNDAVKVYYPTEEELTQFREAAQPAVEALIRETLGDGAAELLSAFQED